MGMSIVLCLVITGIIGWASLVGYALYGSVLFLVILTWLFGSLTVEVDGEELRHYFGPGFWRKTYLLSDIDSVEQVRNSWIFGWGIALYSATAGKLVHTYRCTRCSANTIPVRSGRKFRIGTDNPAGLVSALQISSG